MSASLNDVPLIDLNDGVMVEVLADPSFVTTGNDSEESNPISEPISDDDGDEVVSLHDFLNESEDDEPVIMFAECDICGKEFLNDKFLSRHRTNEHPLSSNDEVQLIKEEKSVQKGHNSSLRQTTRKLSLPTITHGILIKCAYCDSFFTDSTLLRQHSDSCHKDQIETRVKEGKKCSFCPFFSDSLDALTAHIKLSHSASRKTLKCPQCSKCFKYGISLRRHIQMIHEKRLCRICNKLATDAEELQSHMQQAHPETDVKEEFTLRCHICNKGYSKSNTLNRHVRNFHLNIRNHKCSFCDRYFTHLYILRAHVEAVHLHKKDLKCPYCAKLFYKKMSVKIHIQHMHRDKDVGAYDQILCTERVDEADERKHEAEEMNDEHKQINHSTEEKRNTAEEMKVGLD